MVLLSNVKLSLDVERYVICFVGCCFGYNKYYVMYFDFYIECHVVLFCHWKVNENIVQMTLEAIMT